MVEPSEKALELLVKQATYYIRRGIKDFPSFSKKILDDYPTVC